MVTCWGHARVVSDGARRRGQYWFTLSGQWWEHVDVVSAGGHADMVSAGVDGPRPLSVQAEVRLPVSSHFRWNRCDGAEGKSKLRRRPTLS